MRPTEAELILKGTSIHETVVILRRLVQEEPAAFEPALAASLYNLSNRLGDTDAKHALSAVQQATEIYRRLFKSQPGSFGCVPRGAATWVRFSSACAHASSARSICSRNASASSRCACAAGVRSSSP